MLHLGLGVPLRLGLFKLREPAADLRFAVGALLVPQEPLLDAFRVEEVLLVAGELDQVLRRHEYLDADRALLDV